MDYIFLKTKEDVLAESIRRIDSFHPALNYEYHLPPETNYLSWVLSRQNTP